MNTKNLAIVFAFIALQAACTCAAAATVLMQIRTTIDGKDVSGGRASDSNKTVRIYLARIGESKAPERIVATAPTRAAANDGWRQMQLLPGSYYLLVLPPGMEQNPPAVVLHLPSARFGRLTQYKFIPGRGGFWASELGGFALAGEAPAEFRALTGLWFDVPEGRPNIYVGTLSAACTGGRGLFGSLIDSCSDYEISVNPKAQELASNMLALAEPVAIATLAPYGNPLDGVALRDRGPMTLAMSSASPLVAAFHGALLAPWGMLHGTDRDIGLFNLLAVAAAGAADAANRLKAEKLSAQMQPCLQQLSAVVPAVDYVTPFSAALSEAARARGIALTLNAAPVSAPAASGQAGMPGVRMTISVAMLNLMESVAAGSLSLRLGLRVRLESPEGGHVLYDGLLLYAEGFPPQNPLGQGSRLYERLMPERAQPRPIADWCGDGGTALLQQEISIGLRQIANQVLRDLE
jgi:hypothetical protein